MGATGHGAGPIREAVSVTTPWSETSMFEVALVLSWGHLTCGAERPVNRHKGRSPVLPLSLLLRNT
jgi:hypothetical protein